MIKYESSEGMIELSQKLKNVNKLIKYLEGYSKAPTEHQQRINKNIEYLNVKLQTDDLTKLHEMKRDLEQQLKTLISDHEHLSYLEHLQGWYLRPLINHFDNVQKISTLSSDTEGAAGLKNQLVMFIPKLYYHSEREKTIEKLHQFFKFKAKGKGTPESAKLGQKFFSLFEFSTKNPFPVTTLGKLKLPAISYNVPAFWVGMKNEEKSVFVTGLCPLSTIADELGFVLANNKIMRPNLGFGVLPIEYHDIKELYWPKRPILSDYITIKNILELQKNYQNNANVSTIIWYPHHEYYLELTKNIFRNYIEAGEIEPKQISEGLAELKQRYHRLIEYVKFELGLTSNDGVNIKIIDVDEVCYNQLEKDRKKVDFTFFKYIYGSWVNKDLRRILYEQLIIKHTKPVFEGRNVLHLYSSYELWVDILGSLLVEHEGLSGKFSWISYPSLPSLSLSKMREYNASNDDKLYLVVKDNEFRKQIDKIPSSYINHVAPLILGTESLDYRVKSRFNEDFNLKLNELKNFLQI